MLVIRVRECNTRHHVLSDVLGYQASTVRKLLMDAGHTEKDITLHTLSKTRMCIPWKKSM